jgi:hypothetical protein
MELNCVYSSNIQSHTNRQYAKRKICMQIMLFKECILKWKTLVCFASSLFNLLSSSIFINCITIYNTLWIVLQNVIHVPPCFNHVSVIFSQSNFNFHLMSITIFLSHIQDGTSAQCSEFRNKTLSWSIVIKMAIHHLIFIKRLLP